MFNLWAHSQVLALDKDRPAETSQTMHFGAAYHTLREVHI